MSTDLPCCPWCHARNAQLLYTVPSTDGKSYPFFLCSECGVPFFEKTDSTYSPEYYGINKSKFHPAIEQVLDRFRNSRARQIARLIPPDARILDIGCGSGGFLSALHHMGYAELYGVELPGKASERAAQIKGLHLHIGRFETADYPSAFFDAITLFHVFEHLDEPRECLQKIIRALKPGGYLILSYPNIESLQFKFFGRHWLHLDPPRHRFFLPPRILIEELRKEGMSCLSVRYADLEQNPFGCIQSLLNGLGFKRDALFERFKGNQAYAGPLNAAGLIQFGMAGLMAPVVIMIDGIESWCGKGATVKLVFRKE